MKLLALLITINNIEYNMYIPTSNIASLTEYKEGKNKGCKITLINPINNEPTEGRDSINAHNENTFYKVIFSKENCKELIKYSIINK